MIDDKNIKIKKKGKKSFTIQKHNDNEDEEEDDEKKLLRTSLKWKYVITNHLYKNYINDEIKINGFIFLDRFENLAKKNKKNWWHH